MRKEEFEKIYKEMKEKLIRYVKGIIRDRDISEDIVQDTFIKFYENMEKVKYPHAFLYKVARNRSIDYLRKRKNKEEVSLDDEKHSLYLQKNPVKFYLFKKKLEEEIENMPEIFKEIFILRDINGYSYEEISKILKIPLGTVRSRISRARLYLRERLKDVL